MTLLNIVWGMYVRYQDHKKIAVPEFYAGMYQALYDINVRDDLNECMKMDKALYENWNEAINDLYFGEVADFMKAFELAQERSPKDMHKCKKSSKFSAVEYQRSFWWDSFWAQEDAWQIVSNNLENFEDKL